MCSTYPHTQPTTAVELHAACSSCEFKRWGTLSVPCGVVNNARWLPGWPIVQRMHCIMHTADTVKGIEAYGADTVMGVKARGVPLVSLRLPFGKPQAALFGKPLAAQWDAAGGPWEATGCPRNHWEATGCPMGSRWLPREATGCPGKPQGKPLAAQGSHWLPREATREAAGCPVGGHWLPYGKPQATGCPAGSIWLPYGSH